ncbi:MAG TPA: hypothetical protein VH479_03515 [Acidimicrobiales bacterium]|jgi:hypothetical protein
MSRRALLFIPAVVLVVAAAGCGGGGGKSSESSSGGAPGEQSEIGDAASAEGAAGEGETGDAAQSGAPGEDPGLAPGDGPVTTEPEITFTGEGGDQFCSEMADMQASFANSQATEADYSALADKIAAITPPPELAGDWPDFVDMNRSLADDPSGEELRNASPDSMQRFSEISTRVSEYMAQVCGL